MTPWVMTPWGAGPPFPYFSYFPPFLRLPMPLTLLDFRARLAARLVDAAHADWTAATLDEALRAALDDYTLAVPHTAETLLTLPGPGREIALDGVDGLLAVLDVAWPYAPTALEAPRPAGWRVWWDDARPVLMLEGRGGAPQAGDLLRLWYSRPHTIQDLDAAAVTTVFAHHASGLVTGAAGYAAAAEHLDQAGQVRLDPDESHDLGTWAAARLREFATWLAGLRAGPGPGGPAFGPGWPLDKWDR
jgi:hypothetical protein